jgi:dipeptidyl aminopeptidase/acylaminoacyl peptidase
MNVSRMTLRGVVAGRALGTGTGGAVRGPVVRRSRAVVMIGLGLAGVLALAWFPQAARATFAGRNGSILFERGPDHYYKVTIGGRPHPFFPKHGELGLHGTPAVDRSGRRLAVGSLAGFYLVRLDRPALAHDVALENFGVAEPAWSPDGRRLAAESGHEIETFDTQGGHVTRIGRGSSPSWSARGQLAYCGSFFPAGGVVVQNPADPASKSRVVIKNALEVDWSPDGRRLLVTRSERVTHFALWVVNADGSGARRLHEGLGGRWSPDGQSIVFDHGIPDTVSVMSAEGGHARRIAQGSFPRWLPATK